MPCPSSDLLFHPDFSLSSHHQDTALTMTEILACHGCCGRGSTSLCSQTMPQRPSVRLSSGKKGDCAKSWGSSFPKWQLLSWGRTPVCLWGADAQQREGKARNHWNHETKLRPGHFQAQLLLTCHFLTTVGPSFHICKGGLGKGVCIISELVILRSGSGKYQEARIVTWR